MSEFTASLLTAAIQITLVSVPAVLLVWCIGRRCAAASASLALAALIVAAMLSAVTFVPLPNSWTWSSSTEDASIATASDSTARVDSHTDPAIDVGQLIAMLRSTSSTNEVIGWRWSSVFSVGVVSIAAISLVRFLVGLLAIRRLRRRSTPISDPALLTLVEELKRQFGRRCAVDVRESSLIGSAAACGWRRPTVLLASAWRSWGSADLRAVLAHEMAHVQRRDYALGIAARLCLTLSLHHPLALWLASRLRLAQEIAADELAAIVAGGRDCYRRALARMALRHDAVWLGGMAQTFGTTRSTLTRRLTMLLTERNRPLGRAVRTALVGMVVAIGATVSAVRGTAEPPAVEAPVAPLPVFDLGYLPEQCDGFVALRPGLLLNRPEMKPVLDAISTSLHGAIRVMGLAGDKTFPIADIEQVLGPIHIKTMSDEELKRSGHDKRHSLHIGLSYIRMKSEFDWIGFLRSFPKLIAVTETKDGCYELSGAMLGPKPITIRILDGRTIVATPVTAEQLAARRRENAARFGGETIDHVNRSGLTYVLATDRDAWTSAIDREPRLARLIETVGRPIHVALTVPWTETVGATVAINWSTPPNNWAVGRDLALRHLNDALRNAAPDSPLDTKFHGLACELVRSARFQQTGNSVVAQMQSTVRWCDLIGAIMTSATASVEVKESKSKED